MFILATFHIKLCFIYSRNELWSSVHIPTWRQKYCEYSCDSVFTFDQCSFPVRVRLFVQPLQRSVAAPNLYFCAMLKLNICFFPQCAAKTAGR